MIDYHLSFLTAKPEPAHGCTLFRLQLVKAVMHGIEQYCAKLSIAVLRGSVHASGMRSQKKSQRKWLYLGDDDVARLEKLVEAFPSLNEAMVLGTLASAALKSCEGLGYRVLPSAFTIAEEKPSTKNRR